jgi:hypothetical protein
MWDVGTKITAACSARRVTFLSFLSIVLLGALVSTPNTLVAQAAAATRPNIVVIMTDDQSLEEFP